MQNCVMFFLEPCSNKTREFDANKNTMHFKINQRHRVRWKLKHKSIVLSEYSTQWNSFWGGRGVLKSSCVRSGSISELQTHKFHKTTWNFVTNPMGPVPGSESQIFRTKQIEHCNRCSISGIEVNERHIDFEGNWTHESIVLSELQWTLENVTDLPRNPRTGMTPTHNKASILKAISWNQIYPTQIIHGCWKNMEYLHRFAQTICNIIWYSISVCGKLTQGKCGFT